jgi:putative membrane-bound dehydrogenase-like protein
MSHRERRRRIIRAWPPLFLLAIAAAPPRLTAQVSAEQSARLIKPAFGLEATLWASEPMFTNPTNIDIDSRGRVWVAEGRNYRLTNSGNRRFGRIQDADRIMILEDTNLDGKADKATVFADRIFPVPMGIAVEEHHDREGKYTGCRVFVGNSPDLLVLEDTDGDDRADKRYPLLTGFGGIDSDHGVHGMVLGLDGKLYFTHGDGCCSVQHDHSQRQQNFDVLDRSGRHVWTDQLANTLRVNRDGTQFEIICDRQRNNYETCVNSFGNIFTSDNDDDGNQGCRVIWTMDGGHFGYHSPGSPRHWGEDVPGTVPKLVGTGNGSPCGMMVYEGELLPARYKGALFEVDAGTRQVNVFPLSRHGASFRTEHQVLLSSDDSWFRPVDACVAPDGSVFVADWYDAGVGGHDFSDQTTGRIYRVAPRGHKSPKAHSDFSTVGALIAALRSPNIATQDAARRGLIARDRQETSPLLSALLVEEQHPQMQARALWVAHAIFGDSIVGMMLKNADARLREQAVRILGRDCRDNGHVLESGQPARPRPRPAEAHLKELLSLADDPDGGVRLELILALRNISTERAGTALSKLAAAWDGQDRWYLEALGLALENREGSFLSQLFDGSLYGPQHLEQDGRNGDVALAPYFPVDRNESFIAAGTPDQPATALSKYLGLAWRLHRREVLPLLERFLPHVTAPELNQAMDEILARMNEPETASLVAENALRTTDPLHRRELSLVLTRRLAGDWKSAHNQPKVRDLVERSLAAPATRLEGIALAAATRDVGYRPALCRLVRDSKLPEEVRVAAVEALGSFRVEADRVLDQLIADARGSSRSTPLAEAAIRALARSSDARDKLTELLTSSSYPIGLRREALRTLAEQKEGERRLLELARAGRIPEDLKSVASAILHTSRSRRVRDEAATILPLPKTAAGRPLPPIDELIRRDGDAERGRAVFFRTGTNSCSSCHRASGRGQWIGPDLSTIGVKYGRDELLRSILSPSAAIGYNFRAVVAALADGRVITGLPVEETPDRLVLKTALGERVTLPANLIEDRHASDVSLMPEGLAQTMTDQDLVDLLAYVTTLRQPVSIVGQYWTLGPIHEPDGSPALATAAPLDLHATVSKDRGGRPLSWRKVSANAEGLIELTPLLGIEPAFAAYAFTPVVSPVPQQARLILDTPAAVSVWLRGKPLELSAGNPQQNEPKAATVELRRGSNDLLIRVKRDPQVSAQAPLVTTFVSDRPVGFAN